MKVGELIAVLEHLPPDCDVVLSTDRRSDDGLGQHVPEHVHRVHRVRAGFARPGGHLGPNADRPHIVLTGAGAWHHLPPAWELRCHPFRRQAELDRKLDALGVAP